MTPRTVSLLVGFKSSSHQGRIFWTDELGSQGSPFHRALETLLAGVRGVESVTVGRYSATVTIAPHVITPLGAFAAVSTELEDDAEIRYQLRRTLNDDSVVLVLEESFLTDA